MSGAVASSIALVGFGLDSTVDVLSALVIVWQMTRDIPEDREDQAEVFEETQEFEDFCDASDLTVQVDSTTETRFMFNRHGPDGLGYGLEHLRITNVYANAANGNAVTEQVTTVFKDLRVTDNGDGTVTILVLATGNAVVRGPDGKAIARNPGQIRFEALVDNGGTPSDPSDDEFLDVLRDVKGSTGRTDDFCEAVVPVLSG